MDIEDYALEARKTAVYPGHREPLGLAYVALGFVGEATEYLENPDVDEASDIWWYAIALADEIMSDIGHIAVLANEYPVEPHRMDLAMVCAAGRTAEMVKKQLRDGVDRTSQIRQSLIITLAYLAKLQDPVECFEHSVAKLAARQSSGTLLAR